MPELTPNELEALDARSYVAEVKARLRDREKWEVMVSARLAGRTRWALARMVDSMDAQIERAVEPTEEWLRRINTLRRYVTLRLDQMPPLDVAVRSTTKEARAWRAFSARLARTIRETHPEVLDQVWAPYGGMTAAQWLSAREEKGTR